MAPARIPWTDEQRAKLRTAWCNPSLSLRAVADAVGYNLDACINEAWRLALPRRATFRDKNPGRFKPKPAAPPARPLLPGERTLPPLPSEVACQRT